MRGDICQGRRAVLGFPEGGDGKVLSEESSKIGMKKIFNSTLSILCFSILVAMMIDVEYWHFHRKW